MAEEDDPENWTGFDDLIGLIPNKVSDKAFWTSEIDLDLSGFFPEVTTGTGLLLSGQREQ